jgi:hypothetical protein
MKTIKGGLIALCGLLVIILSGCGPGPTKKVDLGRSSLGLLGIVNDSLALLGSKHCVKYDKDDFIVAVPDEYKCDDFGIHLVNYRRQSEVLWEEFHDEGWDYIDQIEDSTLVFLKDQKIGIWKIGQLPVMYSSNYAFHLCEDLYADPSFRKGKNDSLIVSLKSNNSICKQGATLLDQSNYTDFSNIEISDLLGECDDFRGNGANYYCLQKGPCGSAIYQNGSLVDSTVVDTCDDSGIYASFFGSYILTEEAIRIGSNGEWSYVVHRFDFESNKIDQEYLSIRTDFNVFVNGDIVVDYKSIVGGVECQGCY